MLTKEEFEKEYIRMMDSLRTELKGTEGCGGVDCRGCEFDKICSQGNVNFKAFDVIEVVEKWSKDHPITTNAQKFKEVFGFVPDDGACVFLFPCSQCSYPNDGLCTKRFWTAEYKAPEDRNEQK